MFSNPEQLSAAAKASVEARLEMINTVTSKAFESLEKVIDLNINTVKSSLEESTAAAKQLLTVTNPQDFFMLATQAQPNLEKLLTYGRALADISTRTQAEMLQATRERLASSHDAMAPLLTAPAPKKATSATTNNNAPAPKTVSPTVKAEKKAEKPAKVAVVEPAVIKPAPKKAPAKVEVKASTAKEKPVAAKTAAKPAAAAVAKTVAPTPAEKPAAAIPAAAPAPAPIAAPAAKTPEHRPAAKPVAAAPAAPVAPAAKPASLPAKASATTEKNTAKKK